MVFEKGGHFLAFLQEVVILRAETAEAQELGIRNTVFTVLRMRGGVV